ncbi:alpha/beta hydrolase [Nakamurella aerolata]|uniref:Alpha/beta fold hydrolase n=1 Tax=Nakamurella aerolata TaxID=1656892 RepID=A0A849AEM8_9ACTN|nr:alpha/beta hydrolase [Nakamurella aerolata]NNG37638.1 alpha/beta fold hydrolase [Nakamurella aerolata]
MRPVSNRTRALWVLAVVGTVAALLAGCTVGPSARPAVATYGPGGGPPPPPTSAPASSARPTGPGGPGQQAEPLDFGTCSPPDVTDPSPRSQPPVTISLDLTCAELRVPADYQQPSGNSLVLQVARARTAETPLDAAPLVAVIDPPDVGTAGLEAFAASLPAGMLDRQPVVTIDLRGADGELSCLDDSTMLALLSPPAAVADAAAATDLIDLGKQATFDCESRIGSDISRVGSTIAADDLDTLRSALGQDRLQLLGRGLGATIGAEYAHRYPGRVQRLVLDGPADPTATLLAGAQTEAKALEAALDDFTADCAARGADCPLGADPRSTVTELIQQLGETGRGSSGLLINGGTVLLLLAKLLGDQRGWDQLATALGNAAGTGATDGRTARLQGLQQLLSSTFRVSRRSGYLEQQLAYRCNDAAQRPSAEQIASAADAAGKASPTFGAFLVGQAALCSGWPPATAALTRASAPGAAPILVLGAVNDPVSPYAEVQALTRQLASARLLSWQSGQHGSFPGGSCVNTAVERYLTDGAMPTQGAICPP